MYNPKYSKWTQILFSSLFLYSIFFFLFYSYSENDASTGKNFKVPSEIELDTHTEEIKEYIKTPLASEIHLASPKCSHVEMIDGTPKENLQFLDLAHLAHGSPDGPNKIITCSALKSLKESVEDEHTRERITFNFRRCLRCNSKPLFGTKNEEESALESLQRHKTSYLYRHNLGYLTRDYIDDQVSKRSGEARFKKGLGDDVPVIAIVMGVTSRGISFTDDFKHEYVFLSEVLPAYAEFLESGFQYWFLLVADEGDSVFSQEASFYYDTILEEFKKTVGSRCETLPACYSDLKLVSFPNPSEKPGPIFNLGLHAVMEDGADFFYRVNDDVIPVTFWASELTSLLNSNTPKGFGVVGPDVYTDTGGNPHILTIDFVSRVHFHIFETYYPPALADWCMDDWISRVYGNHHTCRLSNVKVNHTTLSHTTQTRYTVDRRVKCVLELEYYYGDIRIHEWMKMFDYVFHHGYLSEE